MKRKDIIVGGALALVVACLIGAISRVDIVDAVTGYRVNGAAPSGYILQGNGTNYVPATPLPTPTPLSFFGSAPGAKVTTTDLAGDPTTDNCAKWIAGGKLGDAGAACGTGGGSTIGFDATNDGTDESTGITHLECDGNGLSCNEPTADNAQVKLNLFGSSPGTKLGTTSLGADPTTNNCVKWGAGGVLDDAGAACGGGGGGTGDWTFSGSSAYVANPVVSASAGDMNFQVAAASAFPVPFLPDIATDGSTGDDARGGGTFTSHNVNMPATVDAGDLLLIVGMYEADPGTVSLTGWTLISGASASDSTSTYGRILYKVADGTEDGTTAQVATTNSVFASHISFRVKNFDSATAPEGAGVGCDCLTTTDPPSLTPSWGSGNTLWLAFTVREGTPGSLSSGPSGYSDASAFIGTNAGLAYAYKQVNAASENPGVFTWSAGAHSVSMTVGVKAGSVVFDQAWKIDGTTKNLIGVGGGHVNGSFYTIGTSNDGLDTASTSYFPVQGTMAHETSSGAARLTWPGPAGTFDQLRCGFYPAPGSGKSYAITLIDGAGDTTVTCTISDTSNNCEDLANTYDVGDAGATYMRYKIVPSGTPTSPTQPTCTMRFTPDYATSY